MNQLFFHVSFVVIFLAFLYIHFSAVLLLTQNWFVGGVFLLAQTLIIAQRIRNEEATMLEKFGDAYRVYMRRTTRFVPYLI